MVASGDDLDTLQALVVASDQKGAAGAGEPREQIVPPSDLAVQAVKNKKNPIKRGHINASWNSPPDLVFWLKDTHTWSKTKLESLCAVAGERIQLPEPAPSSGEIPVIPLTESPELARVREDARRYLRMRLHQLRQEERESKLSVEDLLVRLCVLRVPWCACVGLRRGSVRPCVRNCCRFAPGKAL
jgi:hypothetical protein